MAWTLGLAVVLSLVLALISPEYAIDTTNPEVGLRGIFSQKNVLGRIMALSVIVWLLYAADHRRQRLVALVFAGLSAALVVLSASKTGLVVCLLLVVLLGLAAFARLRRTEAPLLVSVGVLGVGALVMGVIGNVGDLLDVLGRDVTLTGRTELWQLVWDQIQARPWLGYGYDGFWLGWQGPSAQVWASADWLPPDSHNGFLDAWLDVGLVGLVLLLASLLLTLRRALVLLRHRARFDRLLPLLFLGYFVLSNVTETVGLTYDHILWMLFVALTLQPDAVEQAVVRPEAAAGSRLPGAPGPSPPLSGSVRPGHPL